MGHPEVAGRMGKIARVCCELFAAEFGGIPGGLLDVWAEVKAPAMRKRRETERRRIQTSFVFPSTESLLSDFTPAMRKVQWVSLGPCQFVLLQCPKSPGTPFRRR